MTENTSLAVFDPHAAMVADLVKKNEFQDFDINTEEGEAALRSWVYRIKCGCGDIEKVRKATKANILAMGKKIDNRAKELTAPLRAIEAERMKPLKEIEAKKRAAAEAVIKAEDDARLAKEAEEQAELKRREEAVARKEAEIKEKERIEREKQIATEAADNARKEAERKAEIEAEAKERIRIAEEKTERFRQQEAEQAEQHRIKNRKHRQSVHEDTYAGIQKITGDDVVSQNIFDAIRLNKIPNVTINY